MAKSLTVKVSVNARNAREALAILEGVKLQWLLWLEAALGQLVGLEGMRFTISLPPVLLPVFLSMEMRQAKQDNSIVIHEGNAREALQFLKVSNSNG